ncbi:serine hydrolase [Micromonospora sp. NBC_01813]|uniref:serine hydrolase n=1 Tax=Micromonospora sp. NBC_01813 TaxID=2975988 RepID=UPI002DD7D968|nr:serine hydrolase [Micromonospora sp. NBC_01813]WSA10687.1 serine hydrolase [Micromonospora sp. NBC_01813]
MVNREGRIGGRGYTGNNRGAVGRRAARRRATPSRHTRAGGGTSRRSLFGFGVLGMLAAAGVGYVLHEAGGLPAAANAARARTTAGDAEPTARTPSASPDPAAEQRERAVLAAEKVREFAAGLPNRLSFAAVDRTTGAGFRIGDGPRFQTASIVKVDILAALLLRGGDSALTTTERRSAERMITVSDNAAATELFAVIGGVSGLNRANDDFGMTETRPTPSWGTTTTTAADQIRLLRTIVAEDGPLRPGDRGLVLELMSQVVDGQRWGVSAGAGSTGAQVWLKNGWDTVDAHSGQWLVNSIGRIVEGDRDWLVAILSDHHDTLDRGIAVVEQAATIAFDTWRG